MIVVDTSAVLSALVARPQSVPLSDRLVDEELHAPHLLDVEFLHALRRLVTTRSLALTRAEDARDDLLDLPIVRYPHHPLADRIWTLRGALTAYDAAFVALAEALDAPLVTCDAKLGRVKGHGARVEVFTAG